MCLSLLKDTSQMSVLWLFVSGNVACREFLLLRDKRVNESNQQHIGCDARASRFLCGHNSVMKVRVLPAPP